MMEGWKEFELKNVAPYWTNKIDATELNESNYISADNMLPDRGGIVNSVYAPTSGKSTSFKSKDILVSNIRPYFKKIWYANFYGGCSNDVIVFRTNNKFADSRFVYYYLSKDDFFDYMMAGANGTKMPRGNKKAITKYKINLPPLPTQRRIASILSAYDDLIENNLKRIKLLEEKAQLTYEEWFVRMKFPGHETTPINEETGLPEGWEKSYFEGILNFKTGKLDSNALVVDGKYDFYTCAKEVYKTSTYCFDGEAVLLGGNNATGDFALFYANDKFDAYQRTYIVTAEKQRVPLVYVFYYLKKLLSYFQIVSSGASTKFLTMKILNKTKILIPQAEILNQYQGLIKPCFDLILKYDKQNQLLKEARDIMLPRLMMGVIDTDEMEGVHTK